MRCSFETLLQETEPEVTEIHEFEHRDDSILIASIGFFDWSNSVTRIRVFSFSIKSFTIISRLSILTLMTPSTRKLWIGLSGFWYEDENPWCFNRILLSMCKAFDCDLDGRNEICSFWKNWVGILRWTKNHSTFQLFDLSSLWRKAKTTDSSMDYSCTFRKFVIATYIKELRLVILGENWVATSAIFNNKCAFRYSFNVGITEQQVAKEVFWK